MQIQSSCSSSSSLKCTKVCRTCQNLSLASCHSNLDICFWYGLPVPRLLSWGLRLLLVELESSWLSNPQTAAYLPHLSRCEHEENQNQRTPFVKSETLQQDTCLSMWSQTSFPIEEKILHAFQWAQALERCSNLQAFGKAESRTSHGLSPHHKRFRTGLYSVTMCQCILFLLSLIS